MMKKSIDIFFIEADMMRDNLKDSKGPCYVLDRRSF